MRGLSSKAHGALDYIAGLLLILAPWIFGFATGDAAQTVPIVIGILIITMSIFTDYEAGIFRVIPFNLHLGMDILAGAFLALSPWLFGFEDVIVWPHLVFGLLVVGAGIFTRKRPDYRYAPGE